MVKVLALAGDSLAGDGAAAKLASIVRRPDNAPGERKAGQKRASWLYIFRWHADSLSAKLHLRTEIQREVHTAAECEASSVRRRSRVISASVRLGKGQECAVIADTHCVDAHLFLRPGRLCSWVGQSRSRARSLSSPATRGVRTPDLALTKRMLCQLSYGGVGRGKLEGVNLCPIRGREAHDPR